nr:aspartyl-phosphate phosphatase Spo0E family protein [Heyndrickxia ginsengihumi]
MKEKWKVSTNEATEEYYLRKIQKKREEMMQMGLELGFTHEKTVDCSQELDRLLNLYYDQCQRREDPTDLIVIREMSFILYERVKRSSLNIKKQKKALQVV